MRLVMVRCSKSAHTRWFSIVVAVGRPKKNLNRDVRAEIIRHTIETLSTSGEAAIRTKSIAAAAGVTEPTLFHYFENREGLIEAAQSEWYREHQHDMLIPLRNAVLKCTSREEYIEVLRRSLIAGFAPEREPLRAMRVAILGSAMTRPQLKMSLAKAQAKSTLVVNEATNYAKLNGWIPRDINNEAIAQWIVAVMTGRVVGELNYDPVVLDSMTEMTIKALFAILSLP